MQLPTASATSSLTPGTQTPPDTRAAAARPTFTRTHASRNPDPDPPEHVQISKASQPHAEAHDLVVQGSHTGGAAAKGWRPSLGSPRWGFNRTAASVDPIDARPPLTFAPAATGGPASRPLTVSWETDGRAVRLSAAVVGWSPAPAALQYRFVLLAPEGLVLPIPQAPRFQHDPDLRVPVPTLPAPIAGPGPYAFALLVRDAAGVPAGPFAAPSSEAPPALCSNACAAPGGLHGAVACGLCRRGAAAYRPDSDALQRLANVSATLEPYERLALLHEVALVAFRFPPSPDPPGLTPTGAQTVADRLLDAAAPLLADRTAAELLWDVTRALLPGGARGTASALAFLRAALAARQLRASETLAFASRDGRWQARVQRLAIPDLGRALAMPAHNVTVALPEAVPQQLRAALGPAGIVDVVTMVSPPAAPVLTPVATLAFLDAGTGAEIPIAGLLQPIALAFGAPSAPTRNAPAADWYRCVYWAKDEWRGDGTWLMSGAATGTFVCLTTHLTSFAVEPVCARARVCVCVCVRLSVCPSLCVCLCRLLLPPRNQC